MTETVRQRQFIVAVKGDDQDTLVTENIWTCMGFAGIDIERNIVFLCHLDTFVCCGALPDLVTEIRKRGGDPAKFDLYTIAGVHPFFGWGCLAAGLVLALVPPHELFAAALLTCLGGFLSSTRLAFWWWMRRMGVFPRKRKALWSWKGLSFFFRSGVTVSANPAGISKVRTYVHPKPRPGNGPLPGIGLRMRNGRVKS